MSLVVDSLVSEGLVDFKTLRAQVNAVTVSAGTQNITATSERFQYYTGSVAAQVVKMPDATTLAVGYAWLLINDSSQNLTVQDSAAGAIALLNPGQRLEIACFGVGTAAGVWSYSVTEKSPQEENFRVTYPGAGLAVNYNGGSFRYNGVLTQVAAGAITLPASISGTIYIDIDGVVKATASLPNGATPMYAFISSASAVTSLTDVREDIVLNIIWGVLADITGMTSGQAKAAGILEKYARADHTHGNALTLYKSGIVAPATFTGSPKTAPVVFTTPFANANYSIEIRGIDNRSWTYSAKTAAGFTINANANTALTGEVSWEATANGETA